MSANLLAQETSPYLLQHKDNPVHWRPWGPEALMEARLSNKPILLSVGYAACHWCHVMAHESFEDPQTAQVMNALGANQPQITAKTVFSLFRQRRMWMFILYVIGVACVYDVFDQQFATFFKTFFATPQEGTRAFGFATTAGEICNAIIMFCSPWIINRIGAKNTLLIAGVIMATRIIGSSFATTAVEVIALKMLHALEVRSPFMDPDVLALAGRLRTDELLKGGGKRMLREAFATELPPDVFKRRKMGFAVPVGDWFRGSLRSMLRDLLSGPGSFAAGHLNVPAVTRLVDEHERRAEDHSQRLYALLMLELWWRQERR